MMTSLLLETFTVQIVIAAFISFGIFFAGYMLFRKKNQQENKKRVLLHEQAPEVDLIAGENVWSTKLDLARAYLESGRAELAKSVILDVANYADSDHQSEANMLLKAHF